MGGKWGAHGAFWWYAALNLLGFFFCLVLLNETRGLTDLQKKTLYTPITAVALKVGQIEEKNFVIMHKA